MSVPFPKACFGDTPKPTPAAAGALPRDEPNAPVLDTTRGIPAAGMKIELWSRDPAHLIKSISSNSDGRSDEPLLTGDELKVGDKSSWFSLSAIILARNAFSIAFQCASLFPILARNTMCRCWFLHGPIARIAAAEMKSQIPNPKFQGNPKHQIPTTKMFVCTLEFGIWSFFGIWDLGFGIFE